MNSVSSAKEILAKLMASENISVEHANVHTASFNMETRVLTLPMWENVSEEVVDLLIGHEVGHALYTPTEGWHDAVVEGQSSAFRSYLNVIEDARIEKLIQRKFPGLKFQFIKAYKKLMSDGFFQVDASTMNTMNLIDRINLRFKCGQSIGVKFDVSEQKWIPLIEKAEKWEEVVDIAKAMFEEQKQQQEQKRQSQQSEENFDEENSYEEESEDIEDYSGDAEIDSEGLEDSEEEFGEEKSKSSQHDTEKGTSFSVEEDLKSKTEESLHNSIQKEYSTQGANVSRVYLDLETDPNNYVISYNEILQDIDLNFSGTEERKIPVYRKDSYCVDHMDPTAAANFYRKNFLNENKNTINYMVKEFEMRRRGQIALRVSESKTGMIDTLKMNSYKYNDDIFKKMANVPNGKNHGLIMYIDWSGSMQDYLHDTVIQLLNLVYFCRQVNIPFRVFGFSSAGAYDPRLKNLPSNSCFKNSEKVEVLGYSKDFRLLEFFNNNMNSSKFSKMVGILLSISANRCRSMGFYPDHLGLSSTPLIESILSSFKIFEEFKNKNRLDIVNTVFLTDGESDPADILTTEYREYQGESQRITIRPTYRETQTIWKLVNTNTKKEIRLYSNRTQSFVKGLSELFKITTNSSVMGIRLLRRRDTKYALRDLLDNNNWNEIDKNNQLMSKQKFVDIPIRGYDRYMLISVENMNTSNGEIEVENDASKGKIKQAFRKASKGRLTSRIMLNKYMEIIS